MKGFLGTGATFSADLNLIVQIVMGAALLIGMFLAKRKRFRAHKYCQSSVMLLNLVMIFLVMAPSFHRQVEPNIPAKLNDSYYTVASVHAALGTIAELLGLYIVLVAATKLLPPRLRFKRYKPWMRTELVLWWVVILIGLGTYYIWYMKPEPAAVAQQAEAAPQPKVEKRDRVTVTIKNFEFSPQEVEIEPGTTVEWIDESGRHSVLEAVGLFKSDTLVKGDRFEYKFDKPGDYSYHCGEHGKSIMAGVVKVRDAAK